MAEERQELVDYLARENENLSDGEFNTRLGEYMERSGQPAPSPSIGDFELKDLETRLARPEKFQPDQKRRSASAQLPTRAVAKPGLEVEPVDEVGT